MNFTHPLASVRPEHSAAQTEGLSRTLREHMDALDARFVPELGAKPGSIDIGKEAQ